MNSESLSPRLILASSSKYRKMLLHRFNIPFDCQAPRVDESKGKNESPIDLVKRLACEKAAIVSKENPRAIVIGSDQIAVYEDRVVGKPGDYPSAKKQLTSFSGHCIEFHTAVSVQCLVTGFSELHMDSTQVKFRDLQEDEIERYLLAETPYDCAGAFKAESLGITLFESIKSDDPTALIGLPLIHTAAMLRRAGLLLP